MLTKQEIRQLGNKEMMDELQKSRRELLKLQFDVRGGTSKEVHVVKNLKRYVARLHTIAREMNTMNPKPAMKAEAAAAAPMTEEKKAPAKSAPAKKAAPAKKPAAAKAPAKKAATKSAKK